MCITSAREENLINYEMKIAIYLPGSEWLIPETGGTFFVANGLIKELDKRKNLKDKFVLLVDNEKEVQFYENQIQNIGVIPLNRPKKKVKTIKPTLKRRIKFRIKKELKKYIDQPKTLPIKKSYVLEDLNFDDYLQSFVLKHKIGLIYYLIQHKCLSIKIPFVATNWDIAHKSTFYFPEISRIIDQREEWYQNILPKALAVFCESEAGKKELIKYYQFEEKKIMIQPLVPGPVIDNDLAESNQIEILNKFNLTKRKFFFYPAQFWVLKNHKTLVDAFHLLLKKHKNLKLVLTGSDKGNFAYIKRICMSLKIEESVIMPGFVDNDQLYTLYVNAIAMVMPTHLGPTNMPILEAMALNCPVLCSNLEGHIELLGNQDQTFPPFDKEGLISIMESLVIDNDHRENIIRFQRKRYAKSNFNKDFTVDHLIKNFNDVMKIRSLWDF